MKYTASRALGYTVPAAPRNLDAVSITSLGTGFMKSSLVMCITSLRVRVWSERMFGHASGVPNCRDDGIKIF